MGTEPTWATTLPKSGAGVGTHAVSAGAPRCAHPTLPSSRISGGKNFTPISYQM
jgi:hypothetical protein